MLDINKSEGYELRKEGKRGYPITMYLYYCVGCSKQLWYRKSALPRVSGKCRSCANRKDMQMYGTRYDETPVVSPLYSWVTASTRRRETWLYSRGFKKTWAKFKYQDLPFYITTKWEDEH